MSRLAGKIVLITGASSGIGKACALEFAQHGAHLILAARRADRLDELARHIRTDFGVNVHPLPLDVTNRAAVMKGIAGVPTAFQQIDVLVNNAGLVLGLDPLMQVTEPQIDQMLATNIKGLLNVSQAVLPGMKDRNSGHIVNISSIAGTQAYANGSIYCATKHAVDAITKSLRMELVDTKLRVSSVDPGLVETEFSIIRFAGDQSKADAVYKGIEPLVGKDIAEVLLI